MDRNPVEFCRERVYIVAELGINHNGSLKTAIELINAAKEAGADAVKFQKRTVDTVYSVEELDRPRESPFGTTNRDLKYGLEFGYEEYEEIDRCCRAFCIDWFASPWDEEAVRFLEAFEPVATKVASACVTDIGLLEAIRRTGRPVIMSTGMSSYAEIGKAVDTIRDGNNRSMALLATTSSYPCEPKDLHLRRIQALREAWSPLPVGYSGHEVGLWTTLCAVAMGARIVERHLTIDRTMWGSDHASSIEPRGFAKLVEEIRTFEEAAGSGCIGRLPVEDAAHEKLRRFK